MKLYNTQVVFQEFPDEVTLALNISQCPFHCNSCHSQWLWEDRGDDLTDELLEQLILMNDGITCVGIMGGLYIDELIHVADIVHHHGLKCGWYTGYSIVDDSLFNVFDYIKVGPYIKELGGLDSTTTNQRMYRKTDTGIEDITNHFWHE